MRFAVHVPSNPVHPVSPFGLASSLYPSCASCFSWVWLHLTGGAPCDRTRPASASRLDRYVTLASCPAMAGGHPWPCPRSKHRSRTRLERRPAPRNAGCAATGRSAPDSEGETPSGLPPRRRRYLYKLYPSSTAAPVFVPACSHRLLILQNPKSAIRNGKAQRGRINAKAQRALIRNRQFPFVSFVVLSTARPKSQVSSPRVSRQDGKAMPLGYFVMEPHRQMPMLTA
jgi:hypothetical protein